MIFDVTTTDSQLILFVANGGEPIPDSVQEQLFHPFFLGAGRASRNGLGLGLFIANEIAKAHGGSLTVISNEEETRFTFAMPKAG